MHRYDVALYCHHQSVMLVLVLHSHTEPGYKPPRAEVKPGLKDDLRRCHTLPRSANPHSACAQRRAQRRAVGFLLDGTEACLRGLKTLCRPHVGKLMQTQMLDQSLNIQAVKSSSVMSSITLTQAVLGFINCSPKCCQLECKENTHLNTFCRVQVTTVMTQTTGIHSELLSVLVITKDNN